MDKKELNLILEEGEGLKIEFKESFDSKNLAKEIVAFANSEGGRIFLGISDKKEIKGVEISNKLKSRIQDIAHNCDPGAKIEIESFENIIVIDVKEGENKPYQCSSGFYIREGPNSQKLSRDEIIKFVKGVGRIKFDEQINENFKFPEDFDENKFNDFLRKSNVSNNNTKDILVNLSLAIKKGNKIIFNNAGILLFGKGIDRFIRNNKVSCILFKGKERVDIIDRKEFAGDLFLNYENALVFLKQHLKLEYIIKGGGPREERLEIPEEALKEALVNAVIHRDYFETGVNVSVDIFDDRVEITNWGKLLFDRKELGRISAARNPILFDMFYRVNLIEKAGSGIKRVRKLAKLWGIKVRFETSEFFRIVFGRSEVSVGETVGETVGEILLAIEKNPKITREQLHKVVGLSIRGVEWNLAKLKEEGKLRRIGSTKNGHWEVIVK